MSPTIIIPPTVEPPDSSPEIVLDDRPTARVKDARVEPETPRTATAALPTTSGPWLPGPPRTRSGELLAVLRAPSDHPPDPVTARIDAWGEVFVARIDELGTTAARASRDNLEQDAAIGQLVGETAKLETRVGVIETDLAAVKSSSATTEKIVGAVLSRLSGIASPQVVAAVGTLLTIAAGALATYAKARGWLP